MTAPQKYRLTAKALYPNGTEGTSFAEAQASSLPEVFTDMGRKVSDWMPPEDHPDETGVPDAIDLTLSWER